MTIDDNHKTTWTENVGRVVKKIKSGEMDHLTGIEIAKEINRAKSIDYETRPIRTEMDAIKRSRTQEVLGLTNDIEKFSPWHFRIDGFVDLFPSYCTYYILSSKEKGTYPEGELQQFIDYLKLP